MIASETIKENCLERGMNCDKRQVLYRCFGVVASKGTPTVKGVYASLIPQKVQTEYL